MSGSKGDTLDSIYSLFPSLKERSKNKGNKLSGCEQHIRDIIVNIKNTRLSILLVEHNLPLVSRVSEYVYILHKGEIVHHCTKNDLIENKRIQAEYIGVSKYRS
jgi:ABC-type branched-subunit amino acid transport system ATPase component